MTVSARRSTKFKNLIKVVRPRILLPTYNSNDNSSRSKESVPHQMVYRYECNILSLFRREGSDGDRLPGVCSYGAPRSFLIALISMFIVKFYALQKWPQQDLTSRGNSLMPTKTPFRRLVPSPTSPFVPQRMSAQPTAAKILVDQKYAPVPTSAASRAKSGTRLML